MTDDQLQELRDLQDKFLAHPRTIRFCEQYGYSASLFDHGIGPSANSLKAFLAPEYAGAMRSLLETWKRESQ